MGVLGSRPLMKRHARSGVTWGCPYDAVGMQRALDSAIGLPSRSISASRMLAFLMPADVRRSFIPPPGVSTADENVPRLTDPCTGQTGRPSETHRLEPGQGLLRPMRSAPWSC